MDEDLELSTTEQLADWIETCLLVSRSGHFGLDRLFDLAASELNREPHEVNLALNAMSHRRSELGDLYPFEVRHGLAVATRPDSPLRNQYVTLLCATPGSAARQLGGDKDIAKMGELLEDIAEAALANFWGAGGSAIRFGYPSKHGRPEAFDQAVKWLASRIGLDVGSGYRPPRRKDGGVDVVAWRQFLDRRPGFPIALAQCTVQRETFTKTSDIDVRLWASWLAMDADPLSLLVIPGTIRRPGPDWKQLSTVVMVIDRIRLIELLGRGDKDIPHDPWSDSAISAAREKMRASEL